MARIEKLRDYASEYTPEDRELGDLNLSDRSPDALARVLHYLAEVVIAGQLSEESRHRIRSGLHRRGLYVSLGPPQIPE